MHVSNRVLHSLDAFFAKITVLRVPIRYLQGLGFRVYLGIQKNPPFYGVLPSKEGLITYCSVGFSLGSQVCLVRIVVHLVQQMI